MFSDTRGAVRVLAGAAVFLGAVLCSPSSAIDMVWPNGNMEEGFIDANGDTMPNQWGEVAKKGGCQMYYDMETVHGGDGAMRIEPLTDTCSTAWSNGIKNKDAFAGQEITLSGWAKLEGVVGGTGACQVSVQTGCGCGGWKKIEWKTVFGETGTMDWTEFSGAVTLPTAENPICVENSLSCITATVHAFMAASAGKFWLDDLVITYPGGSTEAIMLGEPIRLQSNKVQITENAVSFGDAADYTVSIVRPDGQVYRTISGSGSRVKLFENRPACGTYLVNVKSDRGNAARNVVVSAR